MTINFAFGQSYCQPEASDFSRIMYGLSLSEGDTDLIADDHLLFDEPLDRINTYIEELQSIKQSDEAALSEVSERLKKRSDSRNKWAKKLSKKLPELDLKDPSKNVKAYEKYVAYQTRLEKVNLALVDAHDLYTKLQIASGKYNEIKEKIRDKKPIRKELTQLWNYLSDEKLENLALKFEADYGILANLQILKQTDLALTIGVPNKRSFVRETAKKIKPSGLFSLESKIESYEIYISQLPNKDCTPKEAELSANRETGKEAPAQNNALNKAKLAKAKQD